MQTDRSLYVTRHPGFTYEMPTPEGSRLFKKITKGLLKPGTDYVADTVDAVICIDLYLAGNLDGMRFFIQDMEAHFLENF